MTGWFMTGTGTGVGKTLVTCILAHQLHLQALKPVASGYDEADEHSDSALLLQVMGKKITASAIEEINPWRYAAPLSPHLAAQMEGVAAPTVAQVAAWCAQHKGETLIEGAGGVMTPLNDRETMLDLAMALRRPVVLVAGAYLGSISHTLTALRVLQSAGVEIACVVVSAAGGEDMAAGQTAESIRQLAGAAFPIYTLPYLPDGPRRFEHAPDIAHTWFGRTPRKSQT